MDKVKDSKKKRNIIFAVIAVVVVIGAVLGVYLYKKSQNTPYNYDLSEYVKVGQYKGLKYSLDARPVTDEEVNSYINDLLRQSVQLKDVKDGKVKEGDTVNIDYEGKIDGKTFEGGSAKGQDVVIGNTPMIKGFIEGLVGKKAGDKVTLNLKFPKDYQEKKVAGKPVVFTVKINSVKEQVVPKLDNKFVKENSKGKYKTVAEFKKGIKKDLEKASEQSALSQAKQRLWQEVISKSKVKKYPEKELKEAKKKAENWEKQYKQKAKQQGLSWDKYLKVQMNTDKKGFEKIKDDYAKDIVKNNLVLYYIARKSNIEITDKEFEKKIDKILKQANMTRESFKKQRKMSIDEFAKKNDWRASMLLDEVLDMMIKDGKKVKAQKKNESSNKGLKIETKKSK